VTTRRNDLVFAERDSGPLLMNMVLPDQPTGSDPAIVWLHGGGWYTGDRTLAPPRVCSAAGGDADAGAVLRDRIVTTWRH
jgi:acetyl esterase/lipase